MVQTSCLNTYVEEDFLNLAKNAVKDEYADMLVNQWKEGNLIFKTKPNLKNDGETSFQRRHSKTKAKKSTVTIKKSVAESKYICWKMSVLLHELAHVLHYFNAENPILKEDIHGLDWMVKVKTAIHRGGLKNCAKEERSPHPSCLYKRSCIWCLPDGGKLQQNKQYDLPTKQEKSKVEGNCLYCYTNDSTIKHLKKSISCQEKYRSLYGPQYKARLTQLALKEARIQKRVKERVQESQERVQESEGKPVCCFCLSEGDLLLKVHLRNNIDCAMEYMDKYQCNNMKELREKLFRENAKLRKRKQRAKERQ